MWGSKLTLYYSAKVDGCVICNNAKVLEKAMLKDCDVAAEYEVKKDSEYWGIWGYQMIKVPNDHLFRSSQRRETGGIPWSNQLMGFVLSLNNHPPPFL